MKIIAYVNRSKVSDNLIDNIIFKDEKTENEYKKPYDGCLEEQNHESDEEENGPQL